MFELLDANPAPYGAQLGVPYMKRTILAATAAIALAATASANPIETMYKGPVGIDAGMSVGEQIAQGTSDLTGPGAPPLIKEMVYALTGMFTVPVGAVGGAIFGAVDGLVIEPLESLSN